MRWQKLTITFLFFMMALGGTGGVILVGYIFLLPAA